MQFLNVAEHVFARRDDGERREGDGLAAGAEERRRTVLAAVGDRRSRQFLEPLRQHRQSPSDDPISNAFDGRR